jgi:hypothetical protein
MESPLALISGIIGLVALITFFVMAAALSNISSNLKYIARVMHAWSKDTGIGMIYKCKDCKKEYEGRQPKCPYCGTAKTYTN